MTEQVNQWMEDTRNQLIEKYGCIRPALEPVLMIYEDSINRYCDMQKSYLEGNHTGILLKSIKETVVIILNTAAKLGVSSPLDRARLKKLEAVKVEPEDDTPDYLDTL